MKNISVEIVNHIATVTLNRPPINSLVKSTYIELQQTFKQLPETEGVRVAVLRASGNIFCPGNDVNEFQKIATGTEASEYAQAVSDGIYAIYACKIPVVAAVHGHAFGAGMAMAACADIIIASDEADFGIPEIKVGIIGASGFLGLLVPEKVVRQMSLTGNPISAKEVAHYGGVYKIAPTKDVYDQAIAVAAELCQRGPTALRYFKEAMNINQDARLVEKYRTEIGYTERYIGTGEFNESVSAFVERRNPNYGGNVSE